MDDEVFGLSEEDLDRIGDMLKAYESGRLEMQANPYPVFQGSPLSTNLALVTADIAAAVPIQTGGSGYLGYTPLSTVSSGKARLMRLTLQSTLVSPTSDIVSGQTDDTYSGYDPVKDDVVVYNLMPVLIPTGSYVYVLRDPVSGYWFAQPAGLTVTNDSTYILTSPQTLPSCSTAFNFNKTDSGFCTQNIGVGDGTGPLVVTDVHILPVTPTQPGILNGNTQAIAGIKQWNDDQQMGGTNGVGIYAGPPASGGTLRAGALYWLSASSLWDDGTSKPALVMGAANAPKLACEGGLGGGGFGAPPGPVAGRFIFDAADITADGNYPEIWLGTNVAGGAVHVRIKGATGYSGGGDTVVSGLITALGTGPTSMPVTSITGMGSGVATFLVTPSSAHLASAVTDETGTGNLVFNNSPTFITPVLGTPSSGDLQNCTGLTGSGAPGAGMGNAGSIYFDISDANNPQFYWKS